MSHNIDAILNTHVPPLEELRDIIAEALSRNFKNSHAEVALCPDTSVEPFNLTNSGFGQRLRVAEVGGPGNLFPTLHKNKLFDLEEICEQCELPAAGVFGPGAGPWPIVGVNCEMVADANFSSGKVATKIAKISDTSAGYQQAVIDAPKFSLMANLAVFESDKTANLVHFKCSTRTGPTNLPETIRRAVAERYGNEKLVTLAGIFILREGAAKMHVMPDFPGCPWKESNEIDAWLRYFNMNAPLVCATVFHSNDAGGHKLRLEHTHCFSSHGDAGHYHYDVTPEEVVYEGWLLPAEKVYRIDMI